MTGRRYILTWLLMIGLAVAVPLLALDAYLLGAQRRADDRGAAAAVRARVERAALEADAALDRTQRVLAFLASRPELQTLDGERCAALIKGLTSVEPLLANVGAVDLEGRPLCRAVVNAGAFPNYSHVAWFQGALRQEGPYLSAPYTGEISRKRLLNVVWPLRDPAGKRIGLLAAALDAEALAAGVLSAQGLPQGSVVTLVGADDVIVATNSESVALIGRKAAAAVMERYRLAGERDFVAIAQDGVERLIALKPMRSFGLRAGVGVPTEAVSASSRAHFVETLLTLVGVALLGLGAALFAARRVSEPMASLSRSAMSFAAGDMNARADESLPGEFRDVAVEFNRLVDGYRQSEEARRARAAAEAASEAKSEFLANMSHEIRTPMNAVLGLTHLLLRTPLDERARDYVGKIQGAGRSLLRIINDILDFSKIEAGRIELEQAPFDLDELLEQVRQIVAPLVEARAVEFLMQRGDDVPRRLHGDALRLKQVLINLASNAAKFTERGEVRVGVALQALHGESASVSFTVRDSGIGMTAQEQARLFEAFVQADSATSRKFGGTGLGLVISQRLVRLMGGELTLKSEKGRGSEFSFTLALQRAAASAAAPAAASAAAVRLAGHVLVVDDNELNQLVASELLRAFGLQVSVAADGPQALQLLSGGARFDAVLMDVQMPGMDGFETTRRIRALPQRDGLPVIALTAHAFATERERCLAAGMDDYVSKPIDPERLAACLALWLPKA